MKSDRKMALAIMAGCVAATMTHAEIELGDKVKVDGFLDMSATYKDSEGETTETMSFDQWEVDIHLAPVENVSARIDIDDQPSTAQEEAEVEQAFVTYAFSDALSGKAGKFLSALGYEGAEPTLLYQYSVSATIVGSPGYSSGVGLKYDFGSGHIYGAVLDGSYSADNDADSVSPEVQLVLKPAEGLTVQLGYAVEEFDEVTEDVDGVETTTEGYDKGIANFWVEYKTGGLTLAGEYNSLFDIEGAGSDGDGYLVMANYDWGKPALTVRHSGLDLDNGTEDTEFTISPSYQLAVNLLGILEYRYDDYGDEDANSFAAELLYTF